MDPNVRMIMTDKFGQLMMANTELAAANMTLSKAVQDRDETITALKLELEIAKSSAAAACSTN